MNRQPAGVVPLDVVKSMSGLEFLTALRDGKLPRVHISELVGFDLVELEEGRAVFEGTPGERHYNPLGSVHGGYAATLLDSCMGCCIHSTLPAGTGFTTLEFKITFIRGMSSDTGPVRAEGKVMNVGRRTAMAEGHLRDANGKLLAHGTTTCLVFPL